MKETALSFFFRLGFRLGFMGVLALGLQPMGVEAKLSPEADRMDVVLAILHHVPSGKEILNKAQKFWGLPREALVKQWVRWGVASKTDAILTRHFNAETGIETREREVTIYLKREQPLGDAVLDLAHELIHATSRPAWDPYDQTLTAGRYIEAAIDGQGGEVEAVAAECRVSFEMLERFGVTGSSTRRCKNYITQQGWDRQKIRADFYRVGKWAEQLKLQLASETQRFPLLSDESPQLFSSTGNAPYPVALLREFEQVTKIACENSRKRAQIAVANRKPAADLVQFIEQRCSIQNL